MKDRADTRDAQPFTCPETTHLYERSVRHTKLGCGTRTISSRLIYNRGFRSGSILSRQNLSRVVTVICYSDGWVGDESVHDLVDSSTATGLFRGHAYSGADLTLMHLSSQLTMYPRGTSQWVTTEVEGLVQSGCVVRWAEEADIKSYSLLRPVQPSARVPSSITTTGALSRILLYSSSSPTNAILLLHPVLTQKLNLHTHTHPPRPALLQQLE